MLRMRFQFSIFYWSLCPAHPSPKTLMTVVQPFWDHECWMVSPVPHRMPRFFFNHNIYTYLHAWIAKDTFVDMSPIYCVLQNAVHVCQQITASPTFPLAGLEHHIEIFGSEGSETFNLLEMLSFDDLSHAFQQVAEAIEGFMAKDAEPQADQTSPRYTCEQMKMMLGHLAHSLHFGDPAWPHTESQGKLAIHYLEVVAKSFVWGQEHDNGIVGCFFDERGLSILIRALLTWELPRSIKLQVYQSTCMIIQNAKDIGLHYFLDSVVWTSQMYPDVPGAKKMKDLVVWFCYVFGLLCFVQLQQLCDHFVMGWK